MAFELHDRRGLDDELKRIARKELRRARESLTKPNGVSTTAVHESRKRLKKVRAVLDVLEATGSRMPEKDRRRLKKAARALSALRDRDALVVTLDHLRSSFPKGLPTRSFGKVRSALTRATRRAKDRANRADVGATVAQRLKRIRRAIGRASTHSVDRDDMVKAIGKAYRASRTGFKDALATRRADDTHGWRKRAKRLWYELRLSRRLLTGVGPIVRDLKRLETWLGEEHDLLVLRTTLAGNQQVRSMGREVEALTMMTTERQRQLRDKAFALGRRLHSRKGKTFERALQRRKRATSS